MSPATVFSVSKNWRECPCTLPSNSGAVCHFTDLATGQRRPVFWPNCPSLFPSLTFDYPFAINFIKSFIVIIFCFGFACFFSKNIYELGKYINFNPDACMVTDNEFHSEVELTKISLFFQRVPPSIHIPWLVVLWAKPNFLFTKVSFIPVDNTVINISSQSLPK